MITLKIVDWSTFKECVGLSVQKEQEKYVMSNLLSFAEAYMNVTCNICKAQTMAIYEDEKMVGFTLIYYRNSEEESFYEIRRFMIDQNYQKKGYGKKAFGEILTYIISLPMGQAKKVVLDYMPCNDIASRIYHFFGFQDTEEYNEHGEVRTVYRF